MSAEKTIFALALKTLTQSNKFTLIYIQMKKTFRMVGMFMMAVMMSLTFVACGDDDDDKDVPVDPSNHDTELIGKWVYDASGTDEDGVDYKDYGSLDFDADGTFEQYDSWEETYAGETYKGSVKAWGSWTAEDGVATVVYAGYEGDIDPEDAPELNTAYTATYDVQGSVLNWNGDLYTKKK